ncbi:hypothetical protein [Nocardia brasiliensis]|uniref:hypothetical protein n=1 Tax=Nocardia brasiliensis TaxID=37326 RepID=UPI00366EB856
MRIRSIRPEFWRSDDVDALTWDERLVFIGLWSYVDDNGVGVDKLASICADLFAGDLEREPRETFARVESALSTLHARNLIQRYTVDGKAYLFITTWETHQRVDRPGKSRYPLPTSENAEIREPAATPSRDIRDTPSTGEGEKGRRGEGNTRPPVVDVTHDRASAREPGGAVALRPSHGAQVAARLNATARSAPAHAIAVAFSEALSVPLEAGVLAKVGVEIDSCLAAGIPPPSIAEGLKAWTESDSWSPTQIPAFVHKAANARGRRGRSKPTEKAVDAHAAAEELLREVRTLGDRSE